MQASTSSSRWSTTGAEESSEATSEPESVRGQRRANEKADGDSRDWVRRPLCLASRALPVVDLGSN